MDQFEFTLLSGNIVIATVDSFNWAFTQPQNTNKELIFKLKSDELYGHFKYSWNSSPSLGLATLHEHINGSWKMIYDPYKRDNTPNAYRVIQIGEKLIIKFMISKLPKNEIKEFLELKK